jgi:hypothetical protein
MSFTQPGMFDYHPTGPVAKVPASHASDPETSKVAERSHTASGKRHRNADLVLELVRRHPGRTANEIFWLATEYEQLRLVDFYEVRRRLNDLHKIGLVKVVEQRVCTIKGSLMQSWEAV